MIDPNGIAHIQLTVRDVANSRGFYYGLLHEAFGMAIQYDAPDVFYCIGGRTGVLIRSAAPEQRDAPFDQWRIGLHHFCFRLRSRPDIDALYVKLLEMGATIVRQPEDGAWRRATTQSCSRTRTVSGSRRCSSRARAIWIALRTGRSRRCWLSA